MSVYNSEFYSHQAAGSLESARIILPKVFDLLSHVEVSVRSFVDIGAGAGTWARTASDLGVNDVCAIEGEWIEPVATFVRKELYRYEDASAPISFNRRYDLAVSLEVGEHIGANNAAIFAHNLVKSSDILLFSAAIPGQGGTDHINEQWPNYWVQILASHGYRVFDVIRWMLWDEDTVPFWYRQNLLLFVNEECGDVCRRLDSLPYRLFMPTGANAVVHPEKYLSTRRAALFPSLKRIIGAFPGALTRAVQRRVRGRSG